MVSRDRLIDSFKILELISLPGYVDASFAVMSLESQEDDQHQSHLWLTIWPWAKQPKKHALKSKMQWVRWGWGRKGKTKKEAGLRHVRGPLLPLQLSHFSRVRLLCDPKDGSPPGSPVPGILKARTLEWAAISFSNAWKWKVKVKSPSRIRLLATPWTAAYQAPLSMGFSRQEDWSGVPSPSL